METSGWSGRRRIVGIRVRSGNSSSVAGAGAVGWTPGVAAGMLPASSIAGATRVLSILSFLLIGAIAGWLAGSFVRGGGFGLFGNVIVGVLGAFIGGMVFSLFGLKFVGFVGSLVTATAGAALLLWVVGMVF